MQRPDTIARIEDPAARARAAHKAAEEARRRAAEYVTIRRGAVRALRDAGLSLAQIATALGVTRSRAQQLVEESKRES
jgi:hypothetical protein